MGNVILSLLCWLTSSKAVLQLSDSFMEASLGDQKDLYLCCCSLSVILSCFIFPWKGRLMYIYLNGRLPRRIVPSLSPSTCFALLFLLPLWKSSGYAENRKFWARRVVNPTAWPVRTNIRFLAIDLFGSSILNLCWPPKNLLLCNILESWANEKIMVSLGSKLKASDKCHIFQVLMKSAWWRRAYWALAVML